MKRIAIPVLIVCSYRRRDVGVVENWRVPVRLWGNRNALDVLVASKANFGFRITHGSQKLRSRMFVEHSLTERAELLPFEAAILHDLHELKFTG